MTAVLARMDPVEERTEWLRWRRGGIGGSDIAGLLNMSRFSTPMSIYLDKAGLLDDTDHTSEVMMWGHLLETVIAREFAHRAQKHIIGEQIIVVNSARPWERATIDALVGDTETTNLDQATGDAEIKNSGDFGWDDIPDEYMAQVTWQLGIAEIEQGYLAVLHAGRRLVVYPVPFDPAAFAVLSREAERFWHEHVLAENPPPADGDDATTDALKNAYRTRAVDKPIKLDADTTTLAVEWLARKEGVKTAKTELARVENTLRAALGEHTVGTYDDEELVTWRPQATAAAFDLEGLQRDHPLIAANYQGPKGTARVLRATKTLKQKASTL